MKKLFNFIFIIGPCLFFFIKGVNAEIKPSITYNDIFDTNIAGYVQFKNLATGTVSGSNTTYYDKYVAADAETVAYNIHFAYHYLPSSLGTSSNAGVAISTCDLSFVENNYYSLMVYYVTTSNFYVHNTYAQNNNKIGLGPDWAISFSNFYIDPTSFFAGAVSKQFTPGLYLQYNSITFKANRNANCVAWPVNGNGGGLNSKNFRFVGYKVLYQGTEPPSNNELTNFIAQENEKINQNIDSMKEKQDKTNELIESEDEDTTSKKCGMLCKLKGIFTGIIELPSKLVNLLVNALKSLFVPTDDQLYDIVNESKELTENFGFVGESVNFFLTIFTSLLGLVNANGCVELPEFTIGATSLFESYTFWQAQNVCLGDNAILSANINTIRTITSIVLVSLFINFAARKFFNILSKNDNDQARTDAYDIK